MRTLMGLLCVVALPAMAQVEVVKPWARATPPGATLAAGYMVLSNKAASPDRLVSVSSPVAARVETHMHFRDGDIARMREVKGYEVPAQGRFELKPGGAHLMFVDIKRPFKQGDRIPAVLRFEKSGEVRVEFEVGQLAAPPASHHKH